MEKIPFMVNKDGSLTVDKENLNALLKLFNYSCFTVTCEKDRAVISIEDENKYVGQFTTDDTNKNLNDLRQKLINDLYDKSNYSYNENDVEILKILFEDAK